jgi:hypothetical protein
VESRDDTSVIYVEYVSRRPGVALAEFHAAVNEAQGGWDDAYGEDRLLLNVGRTWRLGPEPEYFAVWHAPAHGLARIDDWDRIFRAGAMERHEQLFRRVARIDAAGCYDALREPVAGRGGTYYAELFRPTGPADAVARLYEERAGRSVGMTLNLLALRIGKLGPEPGGLAVWTVPSFAAIERIARELDGASEPVELVAAGTYADTGREIL